MSSLSSIDKNYVKLAQVVYILKSNDDELFEKNRQDLVLAILNGGYDLNYAVPNDSPVQHFKPSMLGNTALHVAAKFPQHRSFGKNSFTDLIVSHLLRHGADFIRKNHKGLTPLLLACQNNPYECTVVKELMRAHVKYNDATNPEEIHGVSHFHLVCASGDVDVIKFFLNAGVSVNKAVNSELKDFPGYLPLHMAMEFGITNRKAIQLLIENGAALNHLNANGLSPVHVLIQKQIDYDYDMDDLKSQMKYESILEVILAQNGTSLNFVDSIGLSNFHIYCTKKHNFKSEDWKKFLDAGVDVNAPINFDSRIWAGYTPTHFAAHFNLQTVKLLLESGADFSAKDAKGTTPFDLCLQKYKPIEISQVLKAQETLRSIRFQNGAYLTDFLDNFDDVKKFEDYLKNADVNSVIPFDAPLWPGCTVLHVTIILSRSRKQRFGFISSLMHSDTDSDKRSKVALCLKHGANVMKQDARGMTPLNLAYQKRRFVDLIFDHPTFDSSLNPVDQYNTSHFHIACITRRLQVVTDFLLNGADPNVPVQTDLDDMSGPTDWQTEENSGLIKAGYTPLHISVVAKSAELAELLLQNGADPTIIDADGLTWVHRAFFQEHFSNFDHLFWQDEISCKSNPVAPNGLSHFHIACYTGDIDAVKALLPVVSDINDAIISDMSKYTSYPKEDVFVGDTALHLALRSENCSKKLVYLLLKNGADIELKNVDGATPVHTALFKLDHPFVPSEIIEILDLLVKNKKHQQDDVKSRRQCVDCKSVDISVIKKLLIGRKDISIRIVNMMREEVTTVSRHTFDFIKEYVYKELFVQCLQGQELYINKEGLSSFHLSCSENDYDTAEKFIKLGVDINAPKDYFSKKEAGFTALHFAVYRNCERVVELLLKHGANAALQDSMGNTPLHLAALKHPSLITTFLRTTKCDFNIKNVLGERMLNILLKNNRDESFEDLIANNGVFLERNLKVTFENLLKNKSFLESIDLADKMCLVKGLLCEFSRDVFESLIKYIPSITDVDESNGHDVIHYISAAQNDCALNQLFSNLEILVSNGCDLDRQDKKGRTPLHCAAFAYNDNNVRALLLLGADINVKDNRNQSPYSWIRQANYSTVLEIFKEHIRRLKAVGLQIDPVNDNGEEMTREFASDLSKMEKIKVTKSFTIRDILTEKMVMRFPTIPRNERQAIIDYIGSEDLMRAFPAWLPLFNYQRRRIAKRYPLFEPAFLALRGILGPRLPDHCLYIILINLSNEDWQNCFKAC